MLTKDFWYDLPPGAIAQESASPRDSSKLLVLDPKTSSIKHEKFFNIGQYLNPGDLLVVNDTKVFKARLKASLCHSERSSTESKNLGRSVLLNKPDLSTAFVELTPLKMTDRMFEIFLLRPENNTWLALAKPGRKLKVDDVITVLPLRFPSYVGGDRGSIEGLTAKVIEKQDGGIVRLDFSLPIEKVFEFAEAHGQVPTPPYVKDPPKDEKDYQTIYADKLGSAAAPTAGFHFTPELMESLKKQGIKFATVTLHVGLGTFRPIMTEEIEQHVMHQEWIEVTQETCDLIKQTKESGHRVIAVGTTSVRTLESAVRKNSGQLQPFAGFTDLFLKSGDAFHIVDALITNFHLPESTLLVLVSAFAQNKMQLPDQGRQFVLKAYSEAIKNEYRFYSFGDAMLIL